MNILALSTWFPYPPDNGSRQRAFYLLRELARRGHTIRLIAGAQEESEASPVPEALREICGSVTAVSWRWYVPRRRGVVGAALSALSPTPRAVRETPNSEMTAAIFNELQQRPDVVLVFERGMDAYLPELPKSLPIVLDQLELSGDAVRRRGLTGIKSLRYWRSRLRRYRAITAVSEDEAQIARRVLGVSGPPVRVISNGVDTSAYLARDAARIIPGRMIYSGSPLYAPNRDAIAYFVREILPRIVARVPDAHLVVTGRADGERSADARVRYTGFLIDLRPALAEAAVCVVPLREGGGTRIKILEAWAAGVPVVSTAVGAAGLDAVSGEHLLIADTPEAFAEATLALLGDPERAAQIAANARRFVETRYDWGGIGGQLDALLAEVVTL